MAFILRTVLSYPRVYHPVMSHKLTRRSVLAVTAMCSVGGCLSLDNDSNGQAKDGTTSGSGFSADEFGSDATAPMVQYNELNNSALPEASGPTPPLTEKWATEHSLGSIARPTVLGKMIFINGISGVSGFTTRGEQRWAFEVDNFEFGYEPRPLSVAQDRVYATRAVALYALDAKTGDQRWAFTPPTEIDRLTAPAVNGDTVYVVGQPSEQPPTLWALATTDGTVRWQEELDGDWAGPPVVTGDRLYCTTSKSGLYAVNTSNETVSWQRSLNTSPGPPAATAEGVVAPTREGVVCYNRDGSRRWRSTEATGSSLFFDEGPVIKNTTVYAAAGSDDDSFIALGIESGDKQWRTTLPYMSRLPIPTTDSLYFVNSGGQIRIVGRNSGSVELSENLDLSEASKLVISDGSLFIGADGRLLRYD